MKKIDARILPVLLSFLLLAACAKKAAQVQAPAPAAESSASPQAAAAVAPAANSIVGSWEGSSGQDLPVSFTVEGAQVTNMNTSYQGQKDSCSFNGSINSDGPAAINGKSFTAHGKSSDGSIQFTANGTFTSMTEASGTLNWKGKSDLCGDFELQYQWKAKKSVGQTDEP